MSKKKMRTRRKKAIKRDKNLVVRLLESEVLELKKLAKSEGLPQSSFIRSRIFDNKIAA
jgi:predicted DNA binding CopG/RHH family protein